MAPKRCRILGTPLLVGGLTDVPYPGLVVGQAPGRDEHEEGCPFVGAAGSFLRVRLEKLLGADSQKVFMTNAYGWCPKCSDDVQTPTREMVNSAENQRRFKRDVAKCGDSVRAILAVGQVAVEAVTCQRFNDMDDVLCESSYPTCDGVLPAGIPVLPVYHPSYMLRRGGLTAQEYPEWRERILEWRKLICSA